MVDIKVGGPTRDKPRNIPAGKQSPAPKSETPAPVFHGALKQARRHLLEGSLNEMLIAVRRLGKQFLQTPDEKNLDEYRDAVSQYLEKISREIFALKQEMGTASQDGQQKVYQLVETVNQEMEEITRETFKQEKALKLLSSLEEIRGLVLDIML